jgi:hypothetical protein
MASSSKRKRTAKNPHAAEYEIVRPRQDAAQPSATSRTVTFDRNSSGRLGQHTEIAEVEILAEDLAALAQDPEFSSLPDDETLNYEYFEQTVQEDDNEVEPIVQQVPPAKVKKVKQVYLDHFYLRYLLTQMLSLVQNIFAEWLPFRDTHVHELTRHEGWADLSKRCIQCLQAEAAYKCDDCFGPTVHCRGCVVSAHARLPFHRIKASWFLLYSAGLKSDFKYHSTGTAIFGNRCPSLTLGYVYNSDIMVGLAPLHAHLKCRSRFTTPMVHIRLMSRTANATSRLAVTSSQTNSFVLRGSRQVSLVPGLHSHLQSSNNFTISLCKARRRHMTSTIPWYMQRTILVLNRRL